MAEFDFVSDDTVIRSKGIIIAMFRLLWMGTVKLQKRKDKLI